MKRIVYPKKKVSPMKKRIWKILLALLFVFLYMEIQPIRTIGVMEDIAKNELMRPPFGFFTSAYYKAYEGYELDGPIITDMGEKVRFKWYKVLDWGDTAYISATVYRYPTSFSIWDKFFYPRFEKDRIEYYLAPNDDLSGNFWNMLPDSYVGRKIDTAQFRLHPKQKEISDSTEFILKPERVLWLLKKGYFTVEDKQKNYTVVDFYESIALLNTHPPTEKRKETISAKVYVNDSSEVFIIPDFHLDRIHDGR